MAPILADGFASFLGNIWFALLMGVVGFGAGVYLCKKNKV
jgi:hypothetical protein